MCCLKYLVLLQEPEKHAYHFITETWSQGLMKMWSFDQSSWSCNYLSKIPTTSSVWAMMCLQPVTKGSWCNDHGSLKKIQFQVAGLQFFTNVASCMLLSWYQSKPGQHPFPGWSHWQRFRKISCISVISTLRPLLMVGCAGKFITSHYNMSKPQALL